MALRAMQFWNVYTLQQFRDVVIANLLSKHGRRPVKSVSANDPEAVARINHDRWVASCPLDNREKGRECHGVELVDPDAPIYMCHSCGNAAIDGRLLRVRFPPKATMRRIERVLEARPARETRNWQIHETVADLERENRAHGAEVP